MPESACPETGTPQNAKAHFAAFVSLPPLRFLDFFGKNR
jgi:hypothetical protein